MMLCAAGFTAILSTTMSKSPVLPLFASFLGSNPSGIGMVAAVSPFAGIVLSVPAGVLSDRFGRRLMLLFSAFILATAPFMYPFCTKLWQLALIRFYHGFSTAVFVPVAMALVSDLFQKERGERLGWFSTSTLIGRFIAPVTGGSILGMLAEKPLLGYRAVYFFCGFIGLAALFLIVKIPVSKPGQSQPWKETLREFRKILSTRAIVLTCMVEASILFAYGSFETFLPIYSKHVGLSFYETGALLSIQIITLALTKPLMGKFSDRHGRTSQIFGGPFVGAVSIAAIPLFKSVLPLLVISVVFGLSISIVTSATGAYIADLSKEGSRGSAMGLLGSIMDIGHSTGPLVSGAAATYLGLSWSFTLPFFVLAAMAVTFQLGTAGRGKG
ncbi:MAG: MFS transporter [Nitrospirae bacterium]|nr:MFS transporter [Nitrospirota bacterium]